MKVFCAVLVLIFTTSITANAQTENRLLGKISFPNSGAEEAQPDFIEGMLLLHNFEYADAARAFRRAQQKDPDFALAYYGEAKTHNHPIWMQQDRAAAMEALNKLGNTVKARQAKAPTQREKDYLYSLEVLYGNTPESKDKTKQERDDLYMKEMARLHKTYPEDHEITAFYGLSILGTAHEGRDYATYMRAAAELFEVWNANKKHPGAVHYLIHSFDDPIHAPLGLPMAKVYSEIAPAAAHAQHMTSHIFLALGMWEKVVDANIVARRVQTNRQRELNEETTVCGHYPWWLQYGYLQKGEIEEAEQILRTCKERIETTENSGEQYGQLWHYTIMLAHQIVDSENWTTHTHWTVDVAPGSSAGRNYYYISAMAAIKIGNLERARQHLEQLQQEDADARRTIQAKQVESLLLAEDGNTEEGLSLLKEAMQMESELPVSFGPPLIVKPSHELLGDFLLELGKFEEAIEAYEKQLERTPNRRRALVGKERAMGLISASNNR